MTKPFSPSELLAPIQAVLRRRVMPFIRNLRKKLGDDARSPRYIFTEPQVGYRVPRPQDR